jgi:hypothetical protein
MAQIIPHWRGTLGLRIVLPRLQPLPFKQPGLLPMRAYIVEITAKVLVRSETDPDELPADIYSHISEFIRNDDDILTLEVEALPLPPDLCGSPAH